MWLSLVHVHCAVPKKASQSSSKLDILLYPYLIKFSRVILNGKHRIGDKGNSPAPKHILAKDFMRCNNSFINQ